MKHYLITGGAGFIGSNLAEKLCENNFVTIIDDLSTGYILNIPKNKNIKFIKANIVNFQLTKITKKIDGVIHLAAQASVPLSISQFKESSKINLVGMINIMDFCLKNKIPIVYASSSAIYGNLEIGDDQNTESDILSPYALDKYVMEEYSKLFFDIYGLSSIGLRFFNVYGPKQDSSNPYSGVISIFSEQINNDQSITINGGHQTRDFIYVDDVVLCIMAALKEVSKKSICEQVNILTGKSYSIDYLANQISRITEKKININYKELPKGDPEKSSGSIEKMEKVLKVNSSNFTNFSSGLTKTIEFFKRRSE